MKLSTIILSLGLSNTNAFHANINTIHRIPSTQLNMIASRTTSTTTKRKKSLSDRTQAEAMELVNDLAKAGFEVGSAAPRRTFQAYIAFLSTIREFSPQPFRQPEPLNCK